MAVKFIGRTEMVMEIPALTRIGDEFNLESPRFTPGSIGVVTSILGQSVGVTRCRVQVQNGHIIRSLRPASALPVQNAKGVVEEADEAVFVESARDQFENGTQKRQIGGSVQSYDYDPRPRTGKDNVVIPGEMPSSVPVAAEVLSGPEEVSGSGAEGSADVPPAEEAPPVIVRSNPRQPTGTALDFILAPTVDSSAVVKPEEYAKAMGMSVDKPIIGGKRTRRSQYINDWGRDEKGKPVKKRS